VFLLVPAHPGSPGQSAVRRLLLCMHVCRCADYVGFIKKVMKQMQHPQYSGMKKMEVDMRPLDAEEEKAQEGCDWLSIPDLYSVLVIILLIKDVV